mgnify:CR=1 FL=1
MQKVQTVLANSLHRDAATIETFAKGSGEHVEIEAGAQHENLSKDPVSTGLPEQSVPGAPEDRISLAKSGTRRCSSRLSCKDGKIVP